MFENVAKKIALGVIKPVLNRKIQHYNTRDLYKAIFENVNLWASTDTDTNNQTRNLVGKFSRFYFMYEHVITADMLLEHWLKKDRPELYSVIMDSRYKNAYGVPTGKVWFHNQVEGFKQYIRKL